jgi:CheY-like chemotaxis protein/HAMP domain-containing protein/putative methionine-R-sulfoxide reductase with GAF domain
MNTSNSDNTLFTVLRSGLGKTLLISFLLVALLPMLVVSFISLHQARINLHQNAESILEQAAFSKSLQISQYFESTLAALQFEGERHANLRLMENLIRARDRAHKPLQEFINSLSWIRLVDQWTTDLFYFQRRFNFYDIYLIASNGDMLYSVAQGDDLGTNLFTGRYGSTKFATACKRSIETGKASFSDYEYYNPSEEVISGFITVPIVDDVGERIGVLAARFPLDPVTALLVEEGGMVRTLNNYLIGSDLTLRSVMPLDPERPLLTQVILTEQTKLVKKYLSPGIPDVGEEHNAFIYTGPLGQQVIGMHHKVVMGNVFLALITEVDVEMAFSAARELRRKVIVLSSILFLLVLFLLPPLVLSIVRPIIQLTRQTKQVTSGDYTNLYEIDAKNEIGDLSQSFTTMVESLRRSQEQEEQNSWLLDGQLELNDIIRGELSLPEFCSRTVSFLAKYLRVEVGAMYTMTLEKRLRLTGSYALTPGKKLTSEFALGQGIVGQVALEKKTMLLSSVPKDYLLVQSGLGKSEPHSILLVPIVVDGNVLAVLELASLAPFMNQIQIFVEQIADTIGISIQTLHSNHRVQELLEESQTQTEELAAREEELSQANQGLEKQTSALQKSEAFLQAQQEELKQTNEELEEQAQLLEEQKSSLNSQNIRLDEARKEMEIASRYKSEFLANMSHELRTPLNSILLLSQHLANNKEESMTEKQVECAATVHSSGAELLTLINEILDLAKVESGKMHLALDDCFIADIGSSMQRNFQPIAENTGVVFTLQVAADMPTIIRSDCQRIAQILKNLLSNAFKFTEAGNVTLEIRKEEGKLPFKFIVRDSGIGIKQENIESVFRAFQQEDGSTSRKYGGTGLGLSISRELAGLLEGTLNATSVKGEGAVFTLSLPEQIDPSGVEPDKGSSPVITSPQVKSKSDHSSTKEILPPVLSKIEEYLPDDRREIKENSRSILIVEDDQVFARILRDSARERGFKALVAESGETGLQMTEQYRPDGIILDMELPGINGRNVLSRLKENLQTRHIPVHIISAADDTSETRNMGAVGYLTKPVNMKAINTTFSRIEKVISRKVKTVLLVEDDEVMRREVTNLLADTMVTVTSATTGTEARDLQKHSDFDCIIVDLGLPDINGCDLIQQMKNEKDFQTPVIIHTARDLTSQEQRILDTLSDAIVVKDAKSMDRLLDESSLFLHRVATDLPEEKKAIIRKFHDREAILENKKILIVDDDMRNVFSLSSILEEKGIVTEMAENGKVALEKLTAHTDIDLVLMDIMMPEMDGYEAMREIRKMETKLGKIPILALTAKAMKGDRAKCIDAGASDYLAKPVDAEKLFSMLRVWLY